MHLDTVRKWRGRFCRQRLAGLVDRPRQGRPAAFSAVTVAQVKAMACELPAQTGVPLSRWSCPDLAREAVARNIAASVSASTVRRWLAADALKPWQHRSWIFPRDPEFAAKAARVLDLYARTWQGEALGDDDYVISADEKSQLQALRRRHPDLPPGPGRARRQEFEYRRGGTLAYLAAYDVHHARVLGRCAPTTGIGRRRTAGRWRRDAACSPVVGVWEGRTRVVPEHDREAEEVRPSPRDHDRDGAPGRTLAVCSSAAS